jgi:hypothetical protein
MSLTRRKALVLTAPTLALVAAGCQSAPAAAPVAACEPAAANKLLLMVDMVQGAKNLPEEQRAAKSCVLHNRIPRNGEVVWRARIYDPATGEGMTDQEVTAHVDLANGTRLDMNYRAARNDPSELYWTGAWVVPANHPTGTLHFTVLATDKQGRTGEFKPINVPSSLLIVTDEVLEVPQA